MMQLPPKRVFNKAQKASSPASMVACPVPIEPLGYSIKEASHVLGVSETMVRNLIRNGELKVLRVGRRVIIPKRFILKLFLEPV